jgi:hypothetical protein
MRSMNALEPIRIAAMLFPTVVFMVPIQEDVFSSWQLNARLLMLGGNSAGPQQSLRIPSIVSAYQL